MAGIIGPQGTSQKFKNFVNKMITKGKTSLQARRAAATSGFDQASKKKAKRKRG